MDYYCRTCGLYINRKEVHQHQGHEIVPSIRTSRARGRKFSGKCESCGKTICSCKAYQHADESNAAIGANSPWLCRECYQKRYDVEIKTDLDVAKERMIRKAREYAEAGVNFGDIGVLKRFIDMVFDGAIK